MSFNWNDFRRDDGTIDIAKAYLAYVAPTTPFDKRDLPPIVADFCKMLDEVRPITSRQVAALALAQLIMMAKQ